MEKKPIASNAMHMAKQLPAAVQPISAQQQPTTLPAAVQPTAQIPNKALCLSHMHRYVEVQAADGYCYDGIIEHVDDQWVCLAVPGTVDSMRGFFPPPYKARTQSVMDGRQPIRSCRHRFPLAIGNRYQRHLGEGLIDREKIGQVQAAMQRRHAFVREIREQGMLQQIEMEMDNVEGSRTRPDLRKHGKMARGVIANARKPQALRCASDKLGGRR